MGTLAQIETAALDAMADELVVSYWNICQMGARCLQSEEAAEKTARHTSILDGILTSRGIPHQAGRLIKKQTV